MRDDGSAVDTISVSDRYRTDSTSSPAGKRKRTSSNILLQCEVCQRSFGRVEHLRRHTRSHGAERCFRCQVCTKTFNRLDSLQRHELIHDKGGSICKNRGLRACKACAGAKTRCSGTQPCRRCSSKNYECVYPGSYIPEERASISERSVSAYAPDSSRRSNATDLTAFGVLQNTSSSPVALDANPAGSIQIAPSQVTGSVAGRWDYNASAINWLPESFSPDFFNQLDSTRVEATIASPSLNRSTIQETFASPHTRVHASEYPTGTNRHWLETVIGTGQVVAEPQTPSSASHTTGGTGRYYVDGDGGRLPRTGPQRMPSGRLIAASAARYSNAHTGLGKPRFGFPPHPTTHSRIGSRNEQFSAKELISRETYASISEKYAVLCVQPSPYFDIFVSSPLPPIETLNGFVQLYLELFQPLFPMLHVATLNLEGQWLLALALATIGSHLVDSEVTEDYSPALNEFLRRAILTIDVEDGSNTTIMCQVKLCSCIGLMYQGDQGWQRAARSQLSQLAYDTYEYMAEDHVFDIGESNAEQNLESAWIEWIQIESRRRTGYAIWLLDAMCAYQFQLRPLLSLEFGRFPLPCQEVLWEADSALQWRHVFEYSPPSPTLVSAIHSIYVEKRLQPTMGEFSRILLIHGLYHRSWEVEGYFKQPLAGWLPTAERQDSGSVAGGSAWLPQIPVFSRWRNSTCDCLDILHWSANSVIGAASGMEHPTVLHLHLARVIVLTPFRDITNLAYGMTKEDETIDSAQIQEHRDVVRRWAQEDRHKARLAMIHAGVLFWHVRRYSANGFYEPTAVLLASLALWAYGTFSGAGPPPAAERVSTSAAEADTRRHGRGEEEGHRYPPHCSVGEGVQDNSTTTNNNNNNDNDDNDNNNNNNNDDDNDDNEESYPTTINLDRPADDELVQVFIRRGDRMQALMTGVGDVRGAHGPERVLAEGAKLVARLSNWGTSRKAMRVLNNLSLCRQY